MESLQNLAYIKYIETVGIPAFLAKKNSKYLYIEKDGTSTYMGALTNIIYENGGNWHDGYVEHFKLEFENKREDGSNKVYSTSYIGDCVILPIVEIQEDPTTFQLNP